MSEGDEMELNTAPELPLPLQQALDQVLHAVHQHPHHLLHLEDRLKVYGFFNTLSARDRRIARTIAALTVAQRVAPIYDQGPADAVTPTMPRTMLGVTEQLLASLLAGATLDTLDQAARTMEVELMLGTADDPQEVYHHTPETLAALAEEMDSITGELPSSCFYHVWCAFLAAMEALHEALGWSCWNGDSARWAARAYAGGVWTPYETDELPDVVPQGTWDYLTPEAGLRRREFWEWWCTDVILAAWQATQGEAV